MEFELKDVLYIVAIVVSTLITFFGTKHGIKEYIRDKNDETKEQINNLKITLQELKSKDDLQQQVIDQIGNQMKDLIPKLIGRLQLKEQDDEK